MLLRFTAITNFIKDTRGRAGLVMAGTLQKVETKAAYNDRHQRLSNKLEYSTDAKPKE